MFGELAPPGGDIDMYSFTLAAAADVRAMTGPGLGAQAGDTILTLYAFIGGVLGPALAVNDDFAGRAYYSQVTAGALLPLAVGDSYVLEVKHFTALTGTGSYVLDLYATPVSDLVPVFPPIGPGIPSVEVDDPRLLGGVANPAACDLANAGVLAVGGAGTLYVSPADYDFFMFVVGGPTAIRLETHAGIGPTATDTVVHLVDAGLVRLAFDDDSGAGFYSLLNASIGPGVYFAAVSGFGAASGVGSYLLDISCSPGTPITAATLVAHPGGCPGGLATLPVPGLAPILDTRLTSLGGILHCELPFLGTELCIDLINLPAFAPVFRVIGFAPQPLPVNLAFLGAPACDLEVIPAVNQLAFANAAGIDLWALKLPYVLGFLGTSLEMQGLVIDASAVGGITISNRVTVVAGNVY